MLKIDARVPNMHEAKEMVEKEEREMGTLGTKQGMDSAPRSTETFKLLESPGSKQPFEITPSAGQIKDVE